MRSHKVHGDSRISSKSGAKKSKKKARRKAKRPPDYRRPTLLLHKLPKSLAARARIINQCTLCHELKPLTDFYLTKKGDRGLCYRSACKLCETRRSYEYIQKNRRKKAEGGDLKYQQYQKEYYHSHKDKFKEYRKEFIAKNPTYFREKGRERRKRLLNEEIKTIGIRKTKDSA